MVSGAGAGAVINNLQLPPPPAERQILIKVVFAEFQRNVARDFAVNLASTGALNTPASITTQQASPPLIQSLEGTIGGRLEGTATTFNLQNTLNIFAFRPDLNIGVLIQALKAKSLVEILAEPNMITTSGKAARFLVGGEFPVPISQGGAGAGAVTIQFREFGIRLDFLPELTERGSIKMKIKPEVSALDFANAASVFGILDSGLVDPQDRHRG